jgi:hypothetical protein
MSLRLYHLVIDASDPASLARFWAAVLEHDILEEDDEEPRRPRGKRILRPAAASHVDHLRTGLVTS